MACMDVSLADLPLQTMMGQVPILKYMMSDVCGLLRPCLIFVR
jgi:hypothetical protein